MIQIDLNQFALALRQSYPEMDEHTSRHYAERYQERLHPMLQSCVENWIAGRRIENISFAAKGEQGFSIADIMAWRGSNDFLAAMLLLSDYINDPKRGKARILAPIRIHR